MKYIIEIPDDVQYVLFNGKADNKYYTAVRPIAELEELNSDYINEHFGELQDKAYQAGMEKAWEIARRIRLNCEDGGIDGDGLRQMFGTANTYTIIKDNTASEAVAKIKAYDNVTPSDRIEVGDEVRAEEGHVFVVTGITDRGSIYGFDKDGMWLVRVKDRLRKTGKHYDIASILEAMRE